MLQYGIVAVLSATVLTATAGQTQPSQRQSTTQPAAPQGQVQHRHVASASRLPQSAVSAIEESMPGAIIVEVDREEGQNVYRREDRRDSQRLANLPDSVKRAVKERYPDAVIYDAEKDVENNQRVYDLDVLIQGGKMEVKITPSGQFVEIEHD
jgi:biopolymer transport protein ExbD